MRRAPLKALAEHYDINLQILIKWKQRAFVEDVPIGVVRSSILSTEQEAMIVAFGKWTLLTDNSVQFCDLPKNRSVPSQVTNPGLHSSDPTKPSLDQDQVEWMNQFIYLTSITVITYILKVVNVPNIAVGWVAPKLRKNFNLVM